MFLVSSRQSSPQFNFEEHNQRQQVLNKIADKVASALERAVPATSPDAEDKTAQLLATVFDRLPSKTVAVGEGPDDESDCWFSVRVPSVSLFDCYAELLEQAEATLDSQKSHTNKSKEDATTPEVVSLKVTWDDIVTVTQKGNLPAVAKGTISNRLSKDRISKTNVPAKLGKRERSDLFEYLEICKWWNSRIPQFATAELPGIEEAWRLLGRVGFP